MDKNRPIIYFGGNKYIVFGTLCVQNRLLAETIFGASKALFWNRKYRKDFFVRGYCGQLVNLFIKCITGLSYANLKSDS